MTNPLNVENKGLVEKTNQSHMIYRYIIIGSLVSIVVSLAIMIPLLYTQHDHDCNCNNDRKAYMMSVASSMNRAWGDYDYDTYFANADPNIRMIIAEYGVDATGYVS